MTTLVFQGQSGGALRREDWQELERPERERIIHAIQDEFGSSSGVTIDDDGRMWIVHKKQNHGMICRTKALDLASGI